MNGGVRKRYGSWYYYFDAGKIDGTRKKIERKAIGATTKAEAQAILRNAIREYENTGHVFKPSETTLHDYLKFWFEEYVMVNLKYNTQENYKNVINKHINPELGKYKVRSLTPERLQKWINDKHRAGFSRKSLTIFHSVLQNALKKAVYPYKMINENPMQYVSLPKKDGRKTTEADLKILPMSSIIAITRYLEPTNSFYIPFHIGLNTGMRVSEVCALTWDCVDLVNGIIKVEKIMVCVDKEWGFGTPKTASSYRNVNIGGTLIKILKEHKVRQKENKLKYGEFYTNNNFVCTKENGQNVTPASCKWSGQRLRERLGIDFNFHSLRHTHATLLLEKGAPIKDIQARLGHSRSAITLDTYSHLTDKMRNQTVDIFEQFMSEIK